MSLRSFALYGIAVLAIAAAVVYGMWPQIGNVHAEGGSGDRERLVAMDTAATGELAAFIVAEDAAELPTLTFADRDGVERTLDDWKGKVVLVNLWATWCVPCREEMPYFAELQKDYGGDEFEIVAINLDRGEADKADAFLKEVGADNLDLFTDPKSNSFNALKRDGLAFGLPTTVLVDETGKRIGHLIGPAKWDGTDGRNLIDAALGRKAGS